MIVSSTPPAAGQRRSKARIAWLAVFAALVLSSGLFYRHFWYSRPVGEGPAGPAVSGERFEHAWTDRKVMVVGIGDSVTAGYGASRTDKGYFARLIANPDDEFPEMRGKCLSKVLPNLTAKNLALSASTSIECLEVLVPKLEPQDEETFGIIVMTTGGNDIIHNYGRSAAREGGMYGATFEEARPWIESFRSQLDQIIDQIETRFPGGCEFFIANIFDPTDGVGDAATAGLPAWRDGLRIVDAYNDVIAQAAEKRKNVRLIDMYGAFLGHGIHCLQFWRQHFDSKDPHYWYWENLEDPNDRGYDVLRRLFLIEMAQVLPPLLEDGD